MNYHQVTRLMEIGEIDESIGNFWNKESISHNSKHPQLNMISEDAYSYMK